MTQFLAWVWITVSGVGAVLSFGMFFYSIARFQALVQNEVTAQHGANVPVRDIRRSAVGTKMLGMMLLGKSHKSVRTKLFIGLGGFMLSFFSVAAFIFANNHFAWLPSLVSQS